MRFGRTVAWNVKVKKSAVFSGTTAGSQRKTSWTHGCWWRSTRGACDFFVEWPTVIFDCLFFFFADCWLFVYLQRTGKRASVPEERKEATRTTKKDSTSWSSCRLLFFFILVWPVRALLRWWRAGEKGEARSKSPAWPPEEASDPAGQARSSTQKEAWEETVARWPQDKDWISSSAFSPPSLDQTAEGGASSWHEETSPARQLHLHWSHPDLQRWRFHQQFLQPYFLQTRVHERHVVESLLELILWLRLLQQN